MYTSKYKYKRRKQVIMLMITDNHNKWHYLPVKSLPALFRGTTSNNNGDFYCLNCFHSYRTRNKLKKDERIFNNHDYCRIDMPKKHEKIKYLPGEKSLKAPFIICADLECLPKKRNFVKIILKVLTQRKKLSANLQHTHGVQHAHLMIQKTNAKVCKDSKELGLEMNNFKKKEIIPLTNKEIKSYEKQKVCYICAKKFCHDKNKKSEHDLYHKVRDHCHYTGKF